MKKNGQKILWVLAICVFFSTQTATAQLMIQAIDVAGDSISKGFNASSAFPCSNGDQEQFNWFTSDTHGTSGDASDGGTARPSLHARRVDDASLVIDGRVDASWSAATPVTFETDWAGAPTSTVTTVRALWSNKGLYLLWNLGGAGVNVGRVPLPVPNAVAARSTASA